VLAAPHVKELAAETCMPGYRLAEPFVENLSSERPAVLDRQ